MKETTVKITQNDVILRIPKSILNQAFKLKLEEEDLKLINKELFYERFGEVLLDEGDQNTGLDNWMILCDNIFDQMIENCEDFIDDLNN